MRNCGSLLVLLLVGLAPPPRASAADRTPDENLRRARAFVERSDRYMACSRLRRGMKGYGLTVMAGTKIERFDATVVSVMHNWYPHQSVILCKLGGLGLEKTGIVSGMSGSPVFIKDPADGKDKLIGAVAYGWSFQKEPICGVQPIEQMLAIEGVPLPGAKPAKRRPAARAAQAVLDDDFVRAVLDPRKVNFATFGARRVGRARGAVGRGPRMVQLSTPVMISGVRAGTLRLVEKMFAGTGLVPLQAGTVGKAEAAEAAGAKLVPGAALSVPLVAGDSDWAAVGTATEVIGQYVLGFGHAFQARGVVEMPMGPAYVHVVIPSAWTSFKLGSTLAVTGALTSDEYTGVGGRVGKKVKMIPLSVTVRWDGTEQKFEYRLVRHNWLTGALAWVMARESLWANRELPERHTIAHSVDIEFEKYGRYHAANVSSGGYTSDAGSDLTRPLAAMMNTHVGRPVFPKRITMTLSIQRVEKTAEILALNIERHTYRPGETVNGKVTIRPFRAPRTTLDVAMALPKDLRDGEYALTVSDAFRVAAKRQSDMPHRFKVRTVEQLFKAVQEVVEPRMDRLYVQMDLPAGGLAVKRHELEHLPGSIADILARTAPMDTTRYRRSKTVEIESEYVISGSASAAFAVRKHPPRKH